MADELVATCWTSAGDVRPGRTADTSPVPLQERIDAVAAAGYAGIGLGWPDLEAAAATTGLTEVRDRIADAGLVHVEVEFLNDWWLDGPRRERSDAVRGPLLAAAEVLGARDVKAGCGAFGDTRDRGRLRRELRLLAEEAADHGTRIALEPGAGSALDLVGDAIPLLREVAHPAAGLMLDPWHLVRAGLPFAQALDGVPAELIAGVELSDGDAEPVGTLFDDTFDRRLPPGRGAFDVPEFVRVVRGLGWTGSWGVEVMSDTTRAAPVGSVLHDCAAAARAVLA